MQIQFMPKRNHYDSDESYSDHPLSSEYESDNSSSSEEEKPVIAYRHIITRGRRLNIAETISSESEDNDTDCLFLCKKQSSLGIEKFKSTEFRPVKEEVEEIELENIDNVPEVPLSMYQIIRLTTLFYAWILGAVTPKP